jgi:hypothetical protein
VIRNCQQNESSLSDRLTTLLEGDERLARRLIDLRTFSKRVRSAEYHLTNACNIRCKGCWFFEYAFDDATKEEISLDRWHEFARAEHDRGVTGALLIGGEPTLFTERVRAFVELMPYVTISSNGLRALPREGFENVNVALTLFGGGPLDDSLRGHSPSGRRKSGLFQTALDNYRNDDRAIFIYALTSDSLPYITETVRLIADNGNQVTFNYYSDYGSPAATSESADQSELLDAALAARDGYPEAVACHPYFIETLIHGKTPFGTFGYDVCPSISVDHPAHSGRIRNGNPVLPGFNAWAADTKTLNFCCTSGRCEGCRDSQAVYSWLMVSMQSFLQSKAELETWVDIAESYWRQFVWSPYHRRATGRSSDLGAHS